MSSPPLLSASVWLDVKIIFKTLPALCTQCVDMVEQKKKSKGAKSSMVNETKPAQYVV